MLGAGGCRKTITRQEPNIFRLSKPEPERDTRSQKHGRTE